jgi:uncharacterized protein (TIGR00661 family)
MKVLIAPLNWGLGHAARSSALIDILLSASMECAVASDGDALKYLQQHYGNSLQAYFTLPSYPVIYDEKIVTYSVLKRSGGFFRAIQEEHKKLAAIAESEQWDLIISDNRFGAHVHGIPSVFLSHQLNLKTQVPLLDRVASALNQFLMKSFNQIWIPDFPNSLLSGDLSARAKNKRIHFIGALHKKDFSKNPPGNSFQRVIVLSGPEPSRTKWEQRLLHQLKDYGESTLFVRGLPGETGNPDLNSPGVEFVNFMTKGRLNAFIAGTEIFIGRAGYSTVMDLCFLRKPAFLVPTPGQTEQEYLAQYLQGQWPMAFMREEAFDLKMIPDVLPQLKSRRYPEVDSVSQAKKILRLIQSLSC